MKNIYENVSRGIVQYLQMHMFTLQLIPRPKKLKKGGKVEFSGTKEELKEFEEFKLKQDILTQQLGFMKDSLDEAKRKRKLEDVQVYQENIRDLELELEYLNAQLNTIKVR